MPQFRQLHACFSVQRLEFNHSTIHVVLVMADIALGQSLSHQPSFRQYFILIYHKVRGVQQVKLASIISQSQFLVGTLLLTWHLAGTQSKEVN